MKEIILNAPGKNAINAELMHAVIAGIEAAAGQPVLITGAGDAFSAGLNLKELLRLDSAGMHQFLALLDRMTRALFEYPGPTVALVNGHAIAGGCVLALTADYRVMTADPRARIGLNEVALGLRFPPAVMRLVKARVPLRAWEQVILGADLYDAPTALALGLVDEVSDDPSVAAGERLARLAENPPEAYARAKRALRHGVLDVPDFERVDFERVDLPTWTSEAVRAKIASVLAKR
jgi:Delta3-Delta2-enoyl-CoA isomerase